MAKIRIFELARSLNMTNPDLLDRLKEMGIEAKSHLSSLEDDIVEKVRQGVFRTEVEKPEKVEQKRVRSNVIRKRRQPVKSEAEPEAEAPAAQAPEAEEVTAPTAEEAVPEEAADADVSAKAETPTAPETPEEAEISVSEEAPVEEAADQVPPTDEAVDPAEAAPAEEESSPSRKKAKAKKHQAAKIIKFPDAPQRLSNKGVLEVVDDTAPADSPAAPAAATPAGEKDKKPSRKDRKKRGKTESVETEEAVPVKKKGVFKRKEIVEGVALYDRTRGRMRKKGKGGAKVPGGAKTQITTPKAIKRKVRINESISVAELAKRMGVKASEVIARLMGMGVMATLNQQVDFDSAALVAAEFEYEVEKASATEEELLELNVEEDQGNLKKRAPVVTIMGHVDHGKTSLLDVIRQSRITEGEAGGITQHIGAYKVNTANGEVVFLDTPGHEAFTAMRARGARATDIVILVVAADDGIMPQTIEAINHSRAAGVPIVVAVNKIDKEGADPDRVKREASDHGLVPEDWGGDTMFVNVSAKQKLGISDLLDMVLLQAEMLELKANPDKKARGVVIEAKLDPGRGPVATVLIHEGTLSVGETVVCGIHYGKIRAMFDDKGAPLDQAGPATPVELIGLGGVATSGDDLFAVGDEKSAKTVSENRQQKQRTEDLARKDSISLENFFEKMQEKEEKVLNIIIKADVNGSCEAIADSLQKFSSGEVKIHVVHSAPGTIIESDVTLASASNAIVLGFNVRPSPKVRALAAEENVDIRSYDIIYDLIDDIKKALTGMMSSTFEEEVLGRAEVRELFVIPKKGTIAGSYVLDGKIERGRPARLLRDGVIAYNGVIGSLRRHKDDAKEVASGYECGIGIENYNDIKPGDVIECYFLREIKPEL
ncbi:translation initiation factor IF-2 [Desulfosudis oleivorans]|uniref:Translation initiation factor IF-2 n=1 Tax=Desulfosudis oleivorans (strain DSM 6200 / JCM 39069 / Hxd3) TaxID=96561 RepID=IF2_DESOH|nr:translation initiation factor IF-2 [Desulfosudis oleivorans]A8ZZ65.1 RecName: Full=Translation initiation factor IF-2 [Desulfosudis oleivorans Hxd3]ABW68838.1 translation initiation factor IF-2 [Desulfosudis oleivorans Hxd3]